jgi:exodeoxyribonuclease VII large subunit
MARSQLSFYGDDGPKRGEADDAGDRGRSGKPPVWSVTQIVRGAGRLLEGKFTNVWVEGEVSSLKSGAGGHAFFSLVDDEAALPACMWRTSVERLRFSLAEGQMLRVYGRLSVFPKQGRMQFYVDRAEPVGLGALMLELEQRKQRLAAEGLFDPARKRALPAWPRAIGVVTSAHGAAVHDILEVTRRRCPCRIVVSPAVVQGPEAPRSIARALQRLWTQPGIDVIIVGRGGGSVEDLWAFNDERLARTIAQCPLPVVSAVGHEVDVTICDLVADVRAATPSHAAELVVPDRGAALDRLAGLEQRLRRAQTRRLLDERQRLDGAVRRLARLARALVAEPRARLRDVSRRLELLHPRRRLLVDRRRVEAIAARLFALGRALPRSARARLEILQRRLLAQGQHLPAKARARLAALERRLAVASRGLARPARLRLARAAGALDALSPLAVLDRGYAVVEDASGVAVTDAAALLPGAALGIRLARGRVRAEVTEVLADPEPALDPDGEPRR